MLDVAIGYRRRGWTPVPVVFRGKRPVGEAWQHRRITEETARQYFNGAGSGGYNIGLQLGAASGGLTDIDLDAVRRSSLRRMCCRRRIRSSGASRNAPRIAFMSLIFANRPTRQRFNCETLAPKAFWSSCGSAGEPRARRPSSRHRCMRAASS
jgi:hypothetical protein